VAVLTTSYPRHEGDFAGRFVHDLTVHMRARGVDVDVIKPGDFRGFGIDWNNGAGFVGNLKRRPWAAPLVFASMVRALRRAASDADLVHAHWFAGALVAAFAGKPFVVTLHGTSSAGRFEDVELARRAPRLMRRLLGRAHAVICVSERLAEAMRECGLDNVVAIPNGVTLPDEVGEPDDPPVVLYAGRLSPEKNIDVIAEATAEMKRVVVGDGPLRHLLPDTLGFVPHDELEDLYRRAAVVVLASRNEGLPVVVLEAMAHARPVVATSVGGIPTVIEDGVTGLLVPPGDASALRGAIERLLADPPLRRRIGGAARERIQGLCSWERVTERTLAVYRDALAG
jgi:glycosyltransferase involved in cell wall biosynthesis